MRRAAMAALLLLAGCTRCAERPQKPQVEAGPAKKAGTLSAACLGPREKVTSCADTDVGLAADRVTVRLCKLEPRELPGEPEEGVTRAEVLAKGKSLACGKLEDVGSLSTVCSGPAEKECLHRVAQENRAKTDRFWAPKGSKEGLLVFFGESLHSDLPGVEIIHVKKGKATTAFHREPGRTDGTLVFSRLEDVDGDGVPELLGWERAPELDECQPYIPTAVFKLGEKGFVRDEALMQKWAAKNNRKWHGAEADDSITECGEEASEPDRAPIVVSGEKR